MVYKTCLLAGILKESITLKERSRVCSPGRTANDVVECQDRDELESNHKDANTHMLLHAKHAFNTCDIVTIRLPITDVFSSLCCNATSTGFKETISNNWDRHTITQ